MVTNKMKKIEDYVYVKEYRFGTIERWYITDNNDWVWDEWFKGKWWSMGHSGWTGVNKELMIEFLESCGHILTEEEMTWMTMT